MVLNDHSDDAIRVLQIHLGGDRNFCYLLGPMDGDAVAAVDPGFEPDRLADIAGERGLRIVRILVTHGHHDHTGGMARLAARTGASCHAGRDDGVTGAEPLTGGERLALGGGTIEALHTPGHSPGHVCYLYGDHLFTGDLLFCGKIGGTGPHFPRSSATAERASLQRLLQLPDGTRVYPGHDYYGGAGEMPATTIGHERRHNPFLLCASLEEFNHLKTTWADYKRQHGLR